jgi:hypothetical protein
MTDTFNEWQPIHTAPRDGTLIWITSLDEKGEPDACVDAAPMRWNPAKENGLFPGVRGFWEVSDGSLTWHDGEYGPTHWRPIHVQ